MMYGVREVLRNYTGFLIMVLYLAVFFTGCNPSIDRDLKVEDLRCEYRENPLGIDVDKPRLSWVLKSDKRGQKQTAYRILVASSKKNLQNHWGDLWDSGKVISGQSTQVEYYGELLRSGMECYWKVCIWDKGGKRTNWSSSAMWSMGLLEPSDWHQAEWIADSTGQLIINSYDKWGLPVTEWNGPTSPWLRKTFVLQRKPKKATVYVAVMGYHELYINGSKIGNYVLSPALCDYRTRATYLAHDVTGYLKEGLNCIGLWLDRGWTARTYFRLKHGAIAKALLVIIQDDGQRIRVKTDESWKSHDSPISHIGGWTWNDYGGELYDARKEMPGWATNRVDDNSWTPVKVVHPEIEHLSAQMGVENKVIKTIHPISIKEHAAGGYLIDMGRNFTGWFEIRLWGTCGSRVKFQYYEKLTPPKFWDYKQRDEYIPRGEETEVFKNRFNYHAFRWVRVTGLESPPKLSDVKGYLIHPDYESAGEFSCSNALLNRIYNTVNWTYRSLTLGGYIADCPHRERGGYGAEGQAAMESGFNNFIMQTFFNKWIKDWKDSQDLETGEIPATAPTIFGRNSVGWGGIIVTLPWHFYRRYGDKSILEKTYPNMKKYLQWLHKDMSRDGLLYQWGIVMEFLGDWVSPGRDQGVGPYVDLPWRKFFINCHFVYMMRLTSKVASLLDKSEDAELFQKRADDIAEILHQKYFKVKENIYVSEEMPYLALPLLAEIVPQNLHDKVMKNLVKDITQTRKGHIHAGVLGTYLTLKLLQNEDQDDLIFTMVNQTTYPGWGYMLMHDATTFWERWDGIHSQIHSSFLSIGSWFKERLAGIQYDEDAPGYRHFFIRPTVVGDITWVKAVYNSVRGPIEVQWKVENREFRLAVKIPANSTALVFIPGRRPEKIWEGDKIAGKSEGVRFIRMEKGRAMFEVESGRYVFVSKDYVGRS
jgi:alpha-L-rhamnosidase